MHKPYRDCVVAVVTYDMKHFLVGERSNLPGVWQFPQGGIEKGETPDEAILRELREEIGTNQTVVLAKSQGWIQYDFPANLTHRITQRYRGQQQIWYLMRFEQGAAPDLGLSDGEFSATAFRPLSQIVADIIDWKRESYRQGLLALGLQDA